MAEVSAQKIAMTVRFISKHLGGSSFCCYETEHPLFTIFLHNLPPRPCSDHQKWKLNELRMWPGLGHIESSGRLNIVHLEEIWEGAKWAVDTQTDKKGL